MNLSLREGERLMKQLNDFVNAQPLKNIDAVVAPSYLHLEAALKAATNKMLSISAQDCAAYENGAYTGEVSASMLAECGVELVILGHSERRAILGERSETIYGKLRLALKEGLYPILCVGESLEVRKDGKYLDFVCQQLDDSLKDLNEHELERLLIAYEPVWAIGTGETASSEQAQEVHHHLRAHLAKKYDSSFADDVPLLYGGSLKPENARDIFSQPDVDGGLIGGASLSFESFSQLITIGEEVLQ